MTDEEKIKHLGFEICECEPEPDDVCESCGKENIQIYFSGPSDAGTYWCKECIIELYELYDENEADHERIEELEKAGHSSHCAARQVWGDGECECSMSLNKQTDK